MIAWLLWNNATMLLMKYQRINWTMRHVTCQHLVFLFKLLAHLMSVKLAGSLDSFFRWYFATYPPAFKHFFSPNQTFEVQGCVNRSASIKTDTTITIKHHNLDTSNTVQKWGKLRSRTSSLCGIPHWKACEFSTLVPFGGKNLSLKLCEKKKKKKLEGGRTTAGTQDFQRPALCSSTAALPPLVSGGTPHLVLPEERDQHHV